MLRSLIVLPAVLFLCIACSKDQPAPVAPARKAQASSLPFPTNLRVERITSTSARLSWGAVEDADDYDVVYKSFVEGKWKVLTHVGTATTAMLSGLAPNTKYRWTVKADKGQEASRWAIGVNFTTLAASSLSTPPPNSSRFHIDLYWEINYPSPFVQAVEEAVAKWETIIVRDLEDSNAEHLRTYPDMSLSLQDIDDLAIVVRRNPKPGADQEGNVYGAAKIGLRRTAEYYTRDIGLPIYGFIYLPDKPEYREGYRNNKHVKYYSDQLNSLAIHEIGHVLGLAYSFLPRDGNSFSKAYSPKALEVWKLHMPQQYHRGRDYIPIHSGHWSFQYPASDYAKMWIITNSTMSIFRLSQFDVFGHYRAYDNPGGDTYYTDKIITELDVAALDDMGYTVDMNQAEPFMVKMKSAASYGFGKANTHSQIICEGIH